MLNTPCWITFRKMLRSLEAGVENVDRCVFIGYGCNENNHRFKEINIDIFEKNKIKKHGI